MLKSSGHNSRVDFGVFRQPKTSRTQTKRWDDQPVFGRADGSPIPLHTRVGCAYLATRLLRAFDESMVASRMGSDF
jgi:hypothetical protein